MSVALYDLVLTATPGVKAPALSRWPEGGASAQVALSAGAAVVRLRVSAIPGVFEPIVQFTLPVPVGENGAGNMFDSVAVHSHWRAFDWEVVSIAGGGQLRCAVAGLGIG